MLLTARHRPRPDPPSQPNPSQQRHFHNRLPLFASEANTKAPLLLHRAPPPHTLPLSIGLLVVNLVGCESPGLRLER